MPSVSRTVTFLALLAQALAGVTFTNSKIEMFADTPITLTWTDGQEGDVIIRLMSGPSDNLKEVEVLTATGKDNTFTWTPPNTVPSGTYAFEIEDESNDDPNYSASFTFDQTNSAPVTTTATSDAASTSNTSVSSPTTSKTTSAASNPTSTESNEDEGSGAGAMFGAAPTLAALISLFGAGMFALV